MKMDPEFYKNKKILITGGGGFLGKSLINNLISIRKVDKKNIIIPRSRDIDLRKEENCKKVVKDVDVVIHLAANAGGIGYNLKNPGTLFYDNLSMGLHLIEESRKAGVKKFVAIGTVCAYPKFSPIPFKEENLWNGYPEETNAPYGLAKKMLLVQSQAYRSQFGFNAIYLLPVNLYGENDSYNLETSHVMPALLKKFKEAVWLNLNSVDVWGSGLQRREFMHVDDMADACLFCMLNYNDISPINIGTGEEVSIKELAELIKEISGFKGELKFDTTMPEGIMSKMLDVSKLHGLGWSHKISLREGIERTYKELK